MFIAPCIHCGKPYHFLMRNKHPSFSLVKCSGCKQFSVNVCNPLDPCSYSIESFGEIYQEQFPEIVANMRKALKDIDEVEE